MSDSSLSSKILILFGQSGTLLNLKNQFRITLGSLFSLLHSFMMRTSDTSDLSVFLFFHACMHACMHVYNTSALKLFLSQTNSSDKFINVLCSTSSFLKYNVPSFFSIFLLLGGS